jgi:3-dehydroquinate dehydratase/shikimate dehydrogenase
MCIGEGGALSRVLAGKAGAALVYCALEAHREAARGQVPIIQMLERYRFRSIDAATRVFGVVGCPLSHSLSPVVHNAAFSACGMNAVYVPLHVNRDAASFNTFVEAIRRTEWLNTGGLSVTIPHKMHAFEFVGERSGPHARRIGAANTLVFEPDGVSGFNTDFSAAVDTLAEVIAGDDIDGMRVLVLGAGGMARAVVYGLTEAGAEVVVSNRTAAPALQLADEFRCGSINWERRTDAHPEAIINCTSVGMTPAVDQSPYPAAALREGQIVMDTVYTPVETRLIRDATQAGATTATGDALFLRQAARQFHRFTGEVAPLETMHRALRIGLGLDVER